MSQEKAWRDGEADAWFRRAGVAWLHAARMDDPVLTALKCCELPDEGRMLDVGGSTGRIGAGFLHDHPGWCVDVLEISEEAMAAGRKAFPKLRFQRGSITDYDVHPAHYDVVVACAVLHFIERRLLSSAIANTDAALADGGLLVLHDFDPPYPRENHYAHQPGLFTYKQDYTSCYLSLGIFLLEYRRSCIKGSAANPSDPYDRQWMTAVLRKDLRGRYLKEP